MATQELVADDSPLKKFDAPVLKSMETTVPEGGAPRAVFLPATMAEAMELGKLMAAGNFVPKHLRGKPGDCLAVVMQAGRWGMDPFAVGNKTYFVNDRMAYEAQLVSAVVNSSGALDGRLTVDWEGSGEGLVCTVTGKVKGDPGIKRRRVEMKNITTRNSPLWKQDPEQQLAYFAQRAWARLHTPEVLLGVYTPDEVEQMRPIDGGSLKSEPLTGAMLIEQASGQIEQIDEVTGEVISEPNDGTLAEDNPTAAEGPDDSQRGEDHVDDEAGEDIPLWQQHADRVTELITAATDEKSWRKADAEFVKVVGGLPDDVAGSVEKALLDKKRELGGGN